MRWCVFLVVVLSCCSCFLYAQEFDSPAEFPGGIYGLQQYLRTNLKYPEAARKNGVEGVVFVSFEVNEYGYIVKSSVQAIRSLDAACDAEAVRVFKAFREQWKPALKNGVPVSSEFVQPVRFSLTNENVKTFRTVVKEKPNKSVPRNWIVYADVDMKLIAGSVAPGDSVTVFAWKPWLYMIQRGKVAGYISSRALHVTPELSFMAQEIETKSDSLLKYNALADSLKRYGKLHYWLPVLKKDAVSDSWKDTKDPSVNGDANAFLRLYAMDKDITVGECSVVNLSFYVNKNNRIRLQFDNLAVQLNSIIFGSLGSETCWVAKNFVDNVNGVTVKINGSTFDEYRLYSGAYCPMKAEPVTFKPVTLKVASQNKTKIDTLLPFTTKTVTINVRATASSKATETNFFKLTGNYVLSDKVDTSKSDLQYSITLKGSGFTFPLQPPALGNKDFTATFLSEEDLDTAVNDTYYSSKTFTWSLHAKEGSHALWPKPVFSALDPVTGKTNAYSLNRVITTSKKYSNYEAPSASTSKENFILIDVSQSMFIEDYKPNRLSAVKQGVRDFLISRKTCDTGIIVFAGTAFIAEISEPGACYSASEIREIDRDLQNRGTAIGDALWLAIHAATPSASQRKLVLIGDGEDTSSHIHFKRAAALAKQNNIIVYTIGVGYAGEVPYGIDALGNVIKITSNFSDITLKQVAEQAGGKYFHAKSSQDVTRLLKEILGE